jgi:Zn-dependent metalloprotease
LTLGNAGVDLNSSVENWAFYPTIKKQACHRLIFIGCSVSDKSFSWLSSMQKPNIPEVTMLQEFVCS